MLLYLYIENKIANNRIFRVFRREEIIFMRSLLKTILISASSLVLIACQGQNVGTEANAETGSKSNIEEGQITEGSALSIGMVTNEGGIDDRSFNQSAWEGLQKWQEETGAKVQYYESPDQSELVPNLNLAVADDYEIIVGLAYTTAEALSEVAPQYPDQNFALIDGEVDAENVVSIAFKDQESAFLAGVAAALNTNSNHVGFIGGSRIPVIDRFETGFKAGVAYIDENIQVESQYIESFGDASKGRQIANAMYANNVDVIYTASGGSGNGVFTETRNRLEANPDKKLWVIGVDRDQTDEGEWSGGNFTLTSTLKDTGAAIIALAQETTDHTFPAGENLAYGLENEGVSLVQGNLSDEDWSQIEKVKAAIIAGEITVPEFTYSEG